MKKFLSWKVFVSFLIIKFIVGAIGYEIGRISAFKECREEASIAFVSGLKEGRPVNFVESDDYLKNPETFQEIIGKASEIVSVRQLDYRNAEDVNVHHFIIIMLEGGEKKKYCVKVNLNSFEYSILESLHRKFAVAKLKKLFF